MIGSTKLASFHKIGLVLERGVTYFAGTNHFGWSFVGSTNVNSSEKGYICFAGTNSGHENVAKTTRPILKARGNGRSGIVSFVAEKGIIAML